jgi:hypothetical protein
MFSWLKNTHGKPDAMLTFATLSFAVVTINLLLSSFGPFSYGDFNFTFTPLGSDTMGVYLGATLTAYVSRRYTDARHAPRRKQASDESAEQL